MAAPDLDRLAFEQPGEVRRLARGLRVLAGGAIEDDEDYRAGYVQHEHDEDHRYYLTGIEPLDSLAGDIGPAEFVAIGASTGNGKSGFGLKLALENSQRLRGVYYTFEMTREEVEERAIARFLNTEMKMVRVARQFGHPEYAAAVEELRSRNLLIRHPKFEQRTIKDLTRFSERVSADFIVIDYASRLRNWRVDTASQMIEELWEWIKATRTTVFLLVQTKRPNAPGAKRYRPNIHDFGDCRDIENMATRAMMLYRPFQGRGFRDNIAEILVGKNRSGREFTIHTHWVGHTQDFLGMSEDEEANAACCHRRS